MSNKLKIATLSFTVALALAGVMGLLWLLGGSTPSAHADSPHRVAPDCMGVPDPCHTSIQAAVDAASPGDVILVAAGIYTDVHGRPALSAYPNPPTSGIITQVVYISKAVTVRGGYTTAFTDPPDPETNKTTLDAQGEGRVILITGYISPTIEGLRITGGDANKLGGDPWGEWGVGSGMYVITATATISNNWVFSNTIAWRGGGLYLFFSDATLGENTIMSNTADRGGGLYLYDSAATLSGNTVMSNTARVFGGGLCLWRSAATLSGNTVISNTADRGGGLYLYDSAATLSGNTVISNTADRGGGLYLHDSAATLSGNTIISNTALTYPGDYDDGGGGLYLYDSAATLSGNTISANTARWNGGGLYLWRSTATLSGNAVMFNTAVFGGGLYLNDSAATLSGNAVMSNTAGNGGGLYLGGSDATLSGNAIISNTAQGAGGGLYLGGSDATLTNTVVADNQTGRYGSGLFIWVSSPRLLHTTIARNSGGDDSGVYVIGQEGMGTYYSSTVALTNTILVSHTVGITVTTGNTATLESTLWHGNTKDWDGAGTIFTGTHNYWGDPHFAADGYHLTANSAAIDKGVDGGVDTDIDGDPRDSNPDLGADEFAPSPDGNELYLPIIMKGY